MQDFGEVNADDRAEQLRVVHIDDRRRFEDEMMRFCARSSSARR